MLISYRLLSVYSTAISCAYYKLKYYFMNHYTILTRFGTMSPLFIHERKVIVKYSTRYLNFFYECKLHGERKEIYIRMYK